MHILKIDDAITKTETYLSIARQETLSNIILHKYDSNCFMHKKVCTSKKLVLIYRMCNRYTLPYIRAYAYQETLNLNKIVQVKFVNANNGLL